MTWETSLRCSPRVRALFTGVRGRGILRSPFAGSWIGPRNTQARCPKPSPGRLVYADTTPVIPDDMSVPSPAVLGHLGRGYAELRHNGVLGSSQPLVTHQRLPEKTILGMRTSPTQTYSELVTSAREPEAGYGAQPSRRGVSDGCA